MRQEQTRLLGQSEVGDDNPWWYDDPPQYDEEGLLVSPGRAGARCPKTGAQIKKARQDAEMGQEQLARAINVSREAIRLLERGDYVPSVTALLLLEDALGVPMSELVDRDELIAAGQATRKRRSSSGKARAKSGE